MLADSESETDEFERRHFSTNINIETKREKQPTASDFVVSHIGRPTEGQQESRQSRDKDEIGIFGEERNREVRKLKIDS